MRPMRVMPGKKLPGHMGNVTTTIQNLEIIEVNTSENYILVSGNIPGAKGALVLIKSAVKKDKAKEPKELMSQDFETVVDEVVEEVTTETEVTTEEIAEEPVENKEEVVEKKEEETTETTTETTENDNQGESA